MYHVLLLDQWKAVRLPIALACIVAFTIPILSVQLATAEFAFATTPLLLTSQAQWGTAYPILAAGVGLLLGTSAWSRDHRADHVYAMSLPLPRAKYALLKFGAGMLIVVPVVIATSFGTISAAFSASIPEGLTTYPIALTIRFALTTTLAFAIFFAIASATARIAGIVLGGATIVTLALLLFSAAGLEDSVVRPFLSLLLGIVSPLYGFGGRWMLIDV